MIKNKEKIFDYIKHTVSLLFLAGVLFVGLYGSSVQADHVTEFKAKGYAYGAIDDNGDGVADTGIGYISFSCESDGSCGQSNYGVRINTDPNSPNEGKFFGHAWSSNYGWISFNHSDVQSCGPEGGLEISGDVQDFIHNGQSQGLEGYARVLNADGEGWDGCISFSGPITNQEDETQFIAKLTRQDSGELKLSNWAWGNPVIGWIDFNCEYCSVEFIPNNNVIDNPDDPDDPNDDPEDEEDPPIPCPSGTTGIYPDCVPDEEMGSTLSLYVGGSDSMVPQILGNSTYNLNVTNTNNPVDVILIPQTFGVGVQNCLALLPASNTVGGIQISGWSGSPSSLNPLLPYMGNTVPAANQYYVTLSFANYTLGQNVVIPFRLECTTLTTNVPVSADAFVTVGSLPGSVYINANPSDPIDLSVYPEGGDVQLSWGFSNVQEDSCNIDGVIDYTPDDNDSLATYSGEFGAVVQNGNNVSGSGTASLQGIVWPIGFTITCTDFAGNPVTAPPVYITTTEADCTISMEEAGYCSNDIEPIFEEF